MTDVAIREPSYSKFVLDAGTGKPIGLLVEQYAAELRAEMWAATTGVWHVTTPALQPSSAFDEDAYLFSHGASAFWLDPLRWARTPMSRASQKYEPFWLFIPEDLTTVSSGLLDD
jgi:hypothetical protein